MEVIRTFVLILTIYQAQSNLNNFAVESTLFDFVDPDRCRIKEYCGKSTEWDLKFGRKIDASAFFPSDENGQPLMSDRGFPVVVFGVDAGHDTYDQLSTKIASKGFVVILVRLRSKEYEFDLVQDLLRVALDMFWENENPYSIFNGKLYNTSALIAHGLGADALILASHSSIHRHPSVQGLGIFSPMKSRTPGMEAAAMDINIPTLWVTTNTDKHRPIHNGMPLYNRIRMGELPAGVCKTYVEIEGGNHCFHADRFKYHIPWICRAEHQYDLQDQIWSHTEQQDAVMIPLLAAWLDFTLYQRESNIEDLKNHWREVLKNGYELETPAPMWSYLQHCYFNGTFMSNHATFRDWKEASDYRLFKHIHYPYDTHHEL